MVNIISRAPNDLFTFDLFCSLVSNTAADYEAYYVWTGRPDDFKKFINNTNFTKPNVIIGIKDLLDLWEDFDFWQDLASPGVHLLAQLANNNPSKKFVIFTSLENLTESLNKLNVANIQIIPWGGDITNQSKNYPTVLPVYNKNFDSKKTFISLNRCPRAHRLVLLSYLFGNNYNQNGYITFLGQSGVVLPDCILDRISWQFDDTHGSAREYILTGYKKIYTNPDLMVIDSDAIYSSINDNVDNFVKRLSLNYQDSFVEIITESSFADSAYLITEKFLNSVYGCNFPILLSGVGAVNHLKQVGFDLFEDIVDHSYDQIANPFDRIISAIETNKKLLLDPDWAKQAWSANIDRFRHNVEVARDRMYQWYADRARHQYHKISWS
jgi:protein involved in ribonucleotide reduction